MAGAKRRLFTLATALSIAVHAVMLTAVWRHVSYLSRPYEEAGPPEPIIPILIMPRLPPAAAGQPPKPIRLHRRRLRPELGPLPVEPLVAEKVPEPPPPTAPPPPVQARVTVQPTPSRQLSQVLRASPIGCANPSFLSREEREACEARLGRGLAQTPYLPPALGGKQAGFDAAAANNRERLAPTPTGPAAPDAGAGASNRNKPLYEPQFGPSRP